VSELEAVAGDNRMLKDTVRQCRLPGGRGSQGLQLPAQPVANAGRVNGVAEGLLHHHMHARLRARSFLALAPARAQVKSQEGVIAELEHLLGSAAGRVRQLDEWRATATAAQSDAQQLRCVRGRCWVGREEEEPRF
jgi:hypothetical protein